MISIFSVPAWLKTSDYVDIDAQHDNRELWISNLYHLVVDGIQPVCWGSTPGVVLAALTPGLSDYVM